MPNHINVSNAMKVVKLVTHKDVLLATMAHHPKVYVHVGLDIL
jgi:hypothetical protein